MAKRRKASRSRSKSGGYKVETYGIRYGSNTFLIFLAFVVVVAMFLVASMTGFKFY